MAYLAKPTAAKRTAYLRAIGLVQGFQALDLLDRDAVKSGWPRVGMSAEAPRFVWGDPSAADSDARRSAHWHYLDSFFGRRNPGDIAGGFGHRVDVYLVDGKVVAWVDGSPTTHDDAGNAKRP